MGQNLTILLSSCLRQQSCQGLHESRRDFSAAPLCPSKGVYCLTSHMLVEEGPGRGQTVWPATRKVRVLNRVTM